MTFLCLMHLCLQQFLTWPKLTAVVTVFETWLLNYRSKYEVTEWFEFLNSMNISPHTERPIYSSQVSLVYDGLFKG